MLIVLARAASFHLGTRDGGGNVSYPWYGTLLPCPTQQRHSHRSFSGWMVSFQPACLHQANKQYPNANVRVKTLRWRAGPVRNGVTCLNCNAHEHCCRNNHTQDTAVGSRPVASFIQNASSCLDLHHFLSMRPHPVRPHPGHPSWRLHWHRQS